jgi:hypothetical protein
MALDYQSANDARNDEFTVTVKQTLMRLLDDPQIQQKFVAFLRHQMRLNRFHSVSTAGRAIRSV